VLFSAPGAGKYRRVPRRVLFLSDFQLNEVQWQRLQLPIQLAFIFKQEARQDEARQTITALYPSPAGPTEALIETEAWTDIAAAHPALGKLAPAVEALLINRLHRESHEYYLAPIDECFRLTGLLRKHWHGLSGGAQVWQEIGRFFTDLRGRAQVSPSVHRGVSKAS
jgi:hypothetical protein